MRKSIFILAALYFLGSFPIGPAPALAAQDDAARLVRRYFRHLKNGEAEAMRLLLPARIVEERPDITANPQYRKFLRSYYRNAELVIGAIEETGDGQLVHVDIVLQPGEEPIATKLLVKNTDGVEKIEEEPEE